MSSGDVGHFDEEGRLFVDGRDDDMIVSGGENVFPREVEDLLAGHETVAEAAVVGVDDEQFGQRLKAFVVRQGRRQLTEDEVKEYVKSQPRPLQGPARRRVPRRAAAQRHRQGAQARAARGEGRLRVLSWKACPSAPTSSSSGGWASASGEGRRIELHVAVAGFDYGGQRYEVEPALVPVVLDVSRTTNSGWAMRLRFEAGLQGPACAAWTRRT